MVASGTPNPNPICTWLVDQWTVSLHEEGGKLFSIVTSSINSSHRTVDPTPLFPGLTTVEDLNVDAKVAQCVRSRLVTINEIGELVYRRCCSSLKTWSLTDNREIELLQTRDRSLLWQLFDRTTKEISRLEVDFARTYPLAIRVSLLTDCSFEPADLQIEAQRLKAIRLSIHQGPLIHWPPIEGKQVYLLPQKEQLKCHVIDIATGEESHSLSLPPKDFEPVLAEPMKYEPYLREGRLVAFLQPVSRMRFCCLNPDHQLRLLEGHTVEGRTRVWHLANQTRSVASQLLISAEAQAKIKEAEDALTSWSLDLNFSVSIDRTDGRLDGVRVDHSKIHRSLLRAEAEIDEDHWAITLCTLGNSSGASVRFAQEGHATIVIEGVEKGVYFMKSADIGGQKAGSAANVQLWNVGEESQRGFIDRQITKQGVTYVRSKKLVQRMLASIEKEETPEEEQAGESPEKAARRKAWYPQVFFDPSGSDYTEAWYPVRKWTSIPEFFKDYTETPPREADLLSAGQILHKILENEHISLIPNEWDLSVYLDEYATLRRLDIQAGEKVDALDEGGKKQHCGLRVDFKHGEIALFTKPDNCTTWPVKKLSLAGIDVPTAGVGVSVFGLRLGFTRPNASIDEILKKKAHFIKLKSKRVEHASWKVPITEILQAKVNEIKRAEVRAKRADSSEIPEVEKGKWDVHPLWPGNEHWFQEDILIDTKRVIVPVTIGSSHRYELDITEEIRALFREDTGKRPRLYEERSIFDSLCTLSGDRIILTDISRFYESYLEATEEDQELLRKLLTAETLNDLKPIVLQTLSQRTLSFDKGVLTVQHYAYDPEVCLSAIQNCSPLLFERASARLQKDVDFVLDALDCNPLSFAYCKDKTCVYRVVEQRGTALEHAPREFKDDQDVVYVAVAQTPTALQYASERLRDNQDFLFTLMNLYAGNSTESLSHFLGSQRFRESLGFLQEVIGLNASQLANVAKVIDQGRHRRGNRYQSEVGLQTILQYASERLRNDEIFVRIIVMISLYLERNARVFQYASEGLRDKDKVVHDIVHYDGMALEYASPRLRNDFSIVLSANGSHLSFYLTSCFSDKDQDSALQFASDRLKDDHHTVLRAVESKGAALQYASERLRSNLEIISAAVKNDARALQYARWEPTKDSLSSPFSSRDDALRRLHNEVLRRLQGDRIIVHPNGTAFLSEGVLPEDAPSQLLEPEEKREWWAKVVEAHRIALKKLPLTLQYAHSEITDDSNLVIPAMKADGLALQHASARLRTNTPTVLAAVTQNGLALQYAHEVLREDEDIVLAAVKQNGLALQYAHEDLCNREDIVRAAVKQNGLALQYASPILQNNLEVVLAAIKQNRSAIRYANEKLQNDPDVKARCQR